MRREGKLLVMISSLWPLTVKGEIKRVSDDFVPLASGPYTLNQGKQEKTKTARKEKQTSRFDQTVSSHQKQ
jgi:hypothetical protein